MCDSNDIGPCLQYSSPFYSTFLINRLDICTGHRNEDLHTHHPLSPISRKESKSSLKHRQSTTSMTGGGAGVSTPRRHSSSRLSEGARLSSKLSDGAGSSSAPKLAIDETDAVAKTSPSSPIPGVLVTDIDLVEDDDIKEKEQVPKKAALVSSIDLFRNHFCFGKIMVGPEFHRL